MAEQLFLVCIGGTGMRCMEAFAHLCAVGMFDNKEINILSLDTDVNNGNKSKSEELINKYERIKGGRLNGKPTCNTFFSAKLNLYRFGPEYSGNRITYDLLCDLNSGDHVSNKALSDLFFDKNVQGFKLDHGYRAQTHLGSMLMYHAIIEGAKKAGELGNKARLEDQALAEYLDKIHQAGADAKVFIFGSIFGGTGASSIPIIPQALKDAVKLKDKNAKIDNQAIFGSTLLTEYFSFNPPDKPRKRTEKIIADSNNFARNCQAAMMFYENDPTVKATYKKMYLIGWPSKIDFDSNNKSKPTITGGDEQLNGCHMAELLCAFASYDFFNGIDTNPHDILYRSANFNEGSFNFEFQDFIGTAAAKELQNKLGCFFAFAHLVLNSEKLAINQGGVKSLVETMAKESTLCSDYKNIEQQDIKDIEDFIKNFAYQMDGSGKLIPGWFFQIKRSVNGSFLFEDKAFSDNTKELLEFNFGKLFKDSKYHFTKDGMMSKANNKDAYDIFKKSIKDKSKLVPNSEKQKVERLPERVLAHVYNTFTDLFNIIS